MKLSLCITTYNRYEMTIESFAQVLNDDRIDDIVIMDDCSDDGSVEKLRSFVLNDKTGKIHLWERNENIGMSKNKYHAIRLAKNEWCIIFDSDNIIDASYLDAFYDFAIDENGKVLGDLFSKIIDVEKFIFCPDFAKPQFNYREYRQGGNGKEYIYRSGIYAAREAAHEIKHDNFNCLMNTCNYIVHRDFYLKTYQYNQTHKASDTIWHNYNHLKAGGRFAIVPNMEYYHRVHSGSGFMQDVQYNMAKSEEVRKLIQQL